jgi:hypothetical protein
MSRAIACAFDAVFARLLSVSAARPAAASALERALLVDRSSIVAGLRELAAGRAYAAGVRGQPGEVALEHVAAAVVRGLPSELPAPWQVALGVLRMQHRLATRRQSVGVAVAPRQPGVLARLLEHQIVRAPLLLLDRSVVPGDLSGLRSSTTTLRRHLLGTYHAGLEANYDLEILAARDPLALVALRDECRSVVDGTHPDARRWRLLCVYAGAHEALLAQIERALRGELLGLTTDDPDVSFFAFLRFCARQPIDVVATAAAARAGRYRVGEGLVAP